jgi:putative Holliday junction resolvase
VSRSTLGRILGLDYGARRVGAALSDPGRSIATPLEVYERLDPTQDARHYRALVAEHEVERIVVGLPVHTGGREGTAAAQARAWGDWLGRETGAPVMYFDERYTTVEADDVLIGAGIKRRKRRHYRDMLAARILLQNYLEAGCPETETPPLPLDDAGEDDPCEP